MATSSHFPITAAQIGTTFVKQYYNVLPQQPDLVHHFYTDASTMVRIDGMTLPETASGMLQIHVLIMSLNYTGAEIKTIHALESWNGGVLVLVSGSVHLKGFSGRKNFVQTFFLAPQEVGYFVLSDIFQFIGEDQIHQHPMAYLAPKIHDSKLNASTATVEQVSNYMLAGDFQARESTISGNVEQNGRVENYSFPEERPQQVPETENIIDDHFAVHSNGSLQSTMNPVREHVATSIEEPAEEPQKHTYASIVTKGQSTPALPAQSMVNKTTPPTSEWNYVPDPSSPPSFAPSVSVDRFRTEANEEASAIEDEGEVKSVYVKNVPSTASAFEIEEEFKKFGKLKPDGVAIRTRKDIGVCYAFVEFEDIAGVQNAIKASAVQIAGQQVYIEGRRANRVNVFRGARGKVRGRGSYHINASRDRFGGRNFNRGIGQDGDYNRPRGNGNGHYRPTPRQEKAFSNNQQVSRNGSNLSE